MTLRIKIQKFLKNTLSDYSGGTILNVDNLDNEYYVQYISKFGDVREIWFNKDNIK